MAQQAKALTEGGSNNNKSPQSQPQPQGESEDGAGAGGVDKAVLQQCAEMIKELNENLTQVRFCIYVCVCACPFLCGNSCPCHVYPLPPFLPCPCPPFNRPDPPIHAPKLTENAGVRHLRRARAGAKGGVRE